MDDHDAIVSHYSQIREEDRITSGLGTLELVRTQEVLRRHLSAAPCSVIDVGGGTGVHAEWLAADGYSVHVVDLTPRHVDSVVASLGSLGVTAEVGDARSLSVGDASFDVGLLLGPLYHLVSRSDRVRALSEVARVVRTGGVVAVAAINRFASLFDGLARGFLFDPSFASIVEGDLADGVHRNPTNQRGWFTTAYFHHPDELRTEIAEAGLSLLSLVGVEGLAGWLPALADQWETASGRAAILRSAAAVEAEPSLLGLSAHLLAVARVL